ncbi:hypothetical protein FraEuI1c_3711 [Pseudofrankia inefficax]|uniref:Uncharacterized protein n=1 Tax=Pseudofrankia inefficax (strain DSM 45817 / CECT 9037 / DDB 130130 / EuI1c) TaxID=298654 RepID=E3J2Q7_PSEI1|nr:hypothetical protein FraEuI1c_3711 [Pseudofrankia inefficax]
MTQREDSSDAADGGDHDPWVPPSALIRVAGPCAVPVAGGPSHGA